MVFPYWILCCCCCRQRLFWHAVSSCAIFYVLHSPPVTVHQFDIHHGSHDQLKDGCLGSFLFSCLPYSTTLMGHYFANKSWSRNWLRSVQSVIIMVQSNKQVVFSSSKATGFLNWRSVPFEWEPMVQVCLHNLQGPTLLFSHFFPVVVRLTILHGRLKKRSFFKEQTSCEVIQCLLWACVYSTPNIIFFLFFLKKTYMVESCLDFGLEKIPRYRMFFVEFKHICQKLHKIVIISINISFCAVKCLKNSAHFVCL